MTTENALQDQSSVESPEPVQAESMDQYRGEGLSDLEIEHYKKVEERLKALGIDSRFFVIRRQN